MVSDYLKDSRSVEELDALFERDRLAAAQIAKTLFNHEVAAAISNIGEINQVVRDLPGRNQPRAIGDERYADPGLGQLDRVEIHRVAGAELARHARRGRLRFHQAAAGQPYYSCKAFPDAASNQFGPPLFVHLAQCVAAGNDGMG